VAGTTVAPTVPSSSALIKHIDGIADDEITALEIPNGIPIRYDLDPTTLRPIAQDGRRLTG
jgi:2,3-bisphosphoglycerate-dependent phosphoglycerate mutase